MRLDKYLKVSRIIKRRTVANQACDSGRVTVNGKPAKASYKVAINDIVNIKFGNNNLTFKVINLDKHTSKDEVSKMYLVLSDENPDKHISKGEASKMYMVLSNENLEVNFNQ